MIERTFSRKWLLTISVSEQWGFDHDVIKSKLKRLKGICFWCMCDEIGKISYLYHTHLFIVGENVIPFSEVKKKFPMAHIEEYKGSDEDVIAYIRKEGKFETDKEINIKESFEAAYYKPSFISEVFQMARMFFKRKRS